MGKVGAVIVSQLWYVLRGAMWVFLLLDVVRGDWLWASITAAAIIAGGVSVAFEAATRWELEADSKVFWAFMKAASR